jgi:hypothetical protein
MLNNHTQEIRECYQQAAHCVQQAEAQNDPKVKKQFLELTRRWLLLARGYVADKSPDDQTLRLPDAGTARRLDQATACV